MPSRVVIYLAPGGVTNRAAFHELGHAFDHFDATDKLRDRWLRAVGGGGDVAWRSPPNSPHEQFAESYALCALGILPSRGSLGEYGYDFSPTRSQQRVACRAIRDEG